jgi:hypothetical protein
MKMKDGSGTHFEEFFAVSQENITAGHHKNISQIPREMISTGAFRVVFNTVGVKCGSGILDVFQYLSKGGSGKSAANSISRISLKERASCRASRNSSGEATLHPFTP